MGGAVGADVAVVGGGEEVGAPAPIGGAEDQGRRILGLDRGRVVAGALPQLVVGELRGMDVLMRRVPERRLVVEGEEPDPARSRGPELRGDVLHPARDVGRVDRDRGVGGIVRGDAAVVGPDSVAGIRRAPGGAVARDALVAFLGPVFRDGVAPSLLAVAGRPPDRGHGEQHLAARGPGLGHEHVGGRAVREGGGATVHDVEEEPVARRVVGVELPGVAGDRVASPAAGRPAKPVGLGRAAEVRSVDQGGDGPPVGVRVDRDRHVRCPSRARGGEPEKGQGGHETVTLRKGNMPAGTIREWGRQGLWGRSQGLPAAESEPR